MTEYGLYLESGPKRRKTMVHVLDLLGCTANGPTTEAALAATPEAIGAFRRFLRAAGETIDAEAPFTTAVVEHVTEGEWLGNGSPYIVYGPDLEPVTEAELAVYSRRFQAMNAALAGWAESRSADELALKPPDGRSAGAILLHVTGAVGGYLSAALGGASGFSGVYGAAERGQIGVFAALRRVDALAAERLLATTPAERAAIIQRPKDVRTLRKALRRMLEHAWEHLAELSRRPGGPAI